MTTVTLTKRYSREDAQAILAKFRKNSFEELRLLFKEGKAPTFEETEGNTVGLILALNPRVGWLLKLGSKLLFDGPLPAGQGKDF